MTVNIQPPIDGVGYQLVTSLWLFSYQLEASQAVCLRLHGDVDDTQIDSHASRC